MKNPPGVRNGEYIVILAVFASVLRSVYFAYHTTTLTCKLLHVETCSEIICVHGNRKFFKRITGMILL